MLVMAIKSVHVNCMIYDASYIKLIDDNPCAGIRYGPVSRPNTRYRGWMDTRVRVIDCYGRMEQHAWACKCKRADDPEVGK
jgi:hypothetical protein